MAASAKKYQDVDLYALLGVNPEATEKEVNFYIKNRIPFSKLSPISPFNPLSFLPDS